MNNNSIKNLIKIRKYLRKWLSNLGSAQDQAPEVQKKLDQIEWEISALENSPDEAEEIHSPDLNVEIEKDYRSLSQALPIMPQYKPFEFSLSTTAGTISSASVFEYVIRVGDLDTSNAQAYSKTFSGLYFNLETSQKRPNDIRKFLKKLGFQQTLGRFNEAYKGFYSYKGGVINKKAAALSMRNFLDGVQGDLFEIARTKPKENMNWETMSRRLVKMPTASEEIGILVKQEEKRGSLISRLSDILKDRESGAVTNLEYIWTQLLDHAFIVLSLIIENK